MEDQAASAGPASMPDTASADGSHLALAPAREGGATLRERVAEHLAQWGVVWAVALASRLGVLVVGLLAGYAAEGRGIEDRLAFAKAGTFIHYEGVVANGYTLENATEYPLLPGLMWLLQGVGVPLQVAALLLVNVCFLIGIVCFAKLGERYVGHDAAVAGAVLLAVFPTSHFFSLASTESLMLAAMGGATLLALRGTAGGWLAATPLVVLATLSRPPGMLIGILLACIAIGQLRSGALRGRGIAAALACGAAIPLSILAFFAHLRSVTGDALASVHAQEQFGRSMSITGPVKAVTGAIESVRGGSLGEGFELAAAVLVAGMLVWFTLRAAGDRWEVRGWAAFGAASLLLPLATGLVWQMPRFALLIPPVFWMLGRIVERRPQVQLGLVVLLSMALSFKVVFEVVGVSQ